MRADPRLVALLRDAARGALGDPDKADLSEVLGLSYYATERLLAGLREAFRHYDLDREGIEW